MYRIKPRIKKIKIYNEMKTKIILFYRSFPFWFREQFVDDEFEELSKMNSNIVVICISNKEKKTEYKRILSKAKRSLYRN